MIAINEPTVDSASLALERQSCEKKFGIAIEARILMIETVIASSGKDNPSQLFLVDLFFSFALVVKKEAYCLPFLI